LVSQAQAVVPSRHAAEQLTIWLSLGLALGFLVILLWFAMSNRRSAERGVSRVWRQAIWMAGYLLIGITVVSSVLAFY
jgi:sensor c-di-GMP phosphodiesterase-like protein